MVPEEQEDVRMARLLNGLSKTDADQRRQEEVGDIKFREGEAISESYQCLLSQTHPAPS